MEILQINNLRFTYPGRTKPALDGISLTVRRGEFITICGPSGCGKSTLLRTLKPALMPAGEMTGEILFESRPLASLSQREETEAIGFTMQSPENQLVCDKVWHELAFGLESLGKSTEEIRARVAETATYFGIDGKYHANVNELSGGQKQLVALAAAMTLDPRLLILDEPTAQLDPIAASEHLAALGRLNRELGVTVILVEHRLEEAFALSDRVIVMENGRILADAPPEDVGILLPERLFSMMPTASRVWKNASGMGKMPIHVKDGREWLKKHLTTNPVREILPKSEKNGEIILEATDLNYRYSPELPMAVRGFSLKLRRGELYCMLGGNGSGKSTALSLLAGVNQPQAGTVVRRGKCALLPQDPRSLFVKETVREELSEITAEYSQIVRLCSLDNLLESHPYDLSGGEQQRLALAKVLLCEPDILLADEPTKGMDANFKIQFAQILEKLKDAGKTILLVSHDAEFCAEFSDRCGLFFDGAVVTEAPARTFFASTAYYTTQAARMSRGLMPTAVSVRDLSYALGCDAPEPIPEKCQAAPDKISSARSASLPGWRRLAAGISGAIAAICAVIALHATDLSAIGGGRIDVSALPIPLYLVLFAALFAMAAALYQPRETIIIQKRKRSRRASIAIGAVILLIPLTILLGGQLFGARRYYLTSLLVAVETLAVFALNFEGKRPRARELAVIASLCALGVAGRAAFFMLPEFKPVVAITTVAGIALGGSAGFTVGAVTMLVSNLLFGQGPWTPWQMLAMGLIGLIAGGIFRRVKPGRAAMCVYGALASIVIYGGIMNPASAMMWAANPNPALILTYFVTGLPVDLVRAAASALFLWFAGEPMLGKLARMREKYGI